MSLSEFVSYLRDTIPNLLGGSESEISSALSLDESVTTLTKFIEDVSVQTLLVQRRLAGDKEEGEEEETPTQKQSSALFNLRLDVAFASPRYLNLCFTKRNPILVPHEKKPIPLQLTFATISDGQPYEALQSIMHTTLSPFLVSVLNLQSDTEKLGSKEVKKAVADLELALTHLQQDVEMPDVVLTPHHIVTQVMQKAEREGRHAVAEDFQLHLEDPATIPALEKCVTRWSRAIQRVTRMGTERGLQGTTLQEISFWASYERTLHEIKKRREHPEVQLTFDVLKLAKRFRVTVDFDGETGLTKELERAVNYNQMFRDMPISQLLTTTTVTGIFNAIVDIFAHLKKIRNTTYPVGRAIQLVQAISRDVSARMFDVLRTVNLMKLKYSDFEATCDDCKRVFSVWDENDERFRNILREQRKKLGEDGAGAKQAIRKSVPEHQELQDRIEQLVVFRKQHDSLRTVICRVVKPGPDGEVPPEDRRILEDVDAAYNEMRSDVLDLSTNGATKYDRDRQKYSQLIDNVETRLTIRLRDQLGSAENALTMFKIFRMYNVLFVRPRIRGAIREYQEQVIDRVKSDIAKLHQKFKEQYPHTLNCKMSELRDIPPISGHIIWAKSLKRQLDSFLKRLESVLGKGWENHVQGRELKNDGDAFSAMLETESLFKRWEKDVESRIESGELSLQKPVFEMEIRRGLRTQLMLVVNFSHQLVTLSKEVRNLKGLKFHPRLGLVNKAKEASHLYPIAITLRSAVRSYTHTVQRIQLNDRVRLLVAKKHKEMQQKITEGLTCSGMT